jgi:hypothetical protein
MAGGSPAAASADVRFHRGTTIGTAMNVVQPAAGDIAGPER